MARWPTTHVQYRSGAIMVEKEVPYRLFVFGGPASGKSTLVRTINELNPGFAIDLETFPCHHDRLQTIKNLDGCRFSPVIIGSADVTPAEIKQLGLKNLPLHLVFLYCSDKQYERRKARRVSDPQTYWSFRKGTHLKYVDPRTFSDGYSFSVVSTTTTDRVELASRLINFAI